MAVNRIARRMVAQSLRRLITGFRTRLDLDFVAEFPQTRDPALVVLQASLTRLASDVRSLPPRCKRLPAELEQSIARWIMFLSTDLEYGWPDVYRPPLSLGSPGLLSRLSGHAWIQRKRELKFRQSGDYGCWPFLTASELQSAESKPPMISGL